MFKTFLQMVKLRITSQLLNDSNLHIKDAFVHKPCEMGPLEPLALV